MLRLARLIGIAGLLLVPATAGAAPTVRIVVKREPGLTRAERTDVRSDAGVRYVRPMRLDNAEVVAAPSADARAALRRLNADPDVAYAAPDVKLHAASDPGFPQQWYLKSGAPDSDIDGDGAWGVSEGTGITVAVVDTKVDAAHEDLVGNVVGGASFVEPDDCLYASPTPDHGTHVAGILAAVRGNGKGIEGVAPKSKVLPLRALDNCGDGSLSWILDAFDYAAAAHAKVVSASFTTVPWLSAADKDAIDTAFARVTSSHPGTLFVTAAGNEGSDDDARPVYPCASSSGNVVCVGASDAQDAPSCRSNVGNATVDLFAPGEGIYSTAGGGYKTMSGTSMATPMVAGTAALMSAHTPALTVGQIKAKLISSVDPKEGMADISVAGGRLNAYRAVGGAPPVGGGDGNWSTCVVDSDDDGVPDDYDNCVLRPNPGQEDADGDAAGDGCDDTPRGPDADGDGKAALDDACPTQFATTPNGCPIATATVTLTPTPTVTPTPPIQRSLIPELTLPGSGSNARVRFTVRCDSVCSGSARLTVSKALARRLGMGRKRTLVARAVRLSRAGTKRYTLKLSRKTTRAMRRRGMRRLKTALTVSARDAEGQRASASSAPRIRR